MISGYHTYLVAVTTREEDCARALKVLLPLSAACRISQSHLAYAGNAFLLFCPFHTEDL